MDQIIVAGHPDQIPVSPIAAQRLRERLDAVRENRGAEAADALEHLVGARLGQLLAEGRPSIDLATMRAVVDFVQPPVEEEEPSGLGRVVQELKDRAAQRGLRTMS